jgi:hypothetical protein
LRERRIQPRFEVCLTARWQGSATNLHVRIADLSESGCYVDTIGEVSVGETLFLQILLPDGKWFKLQGIVAHHFSRLGFGVRFINLNEEQRRQIRLLLPNASQCFSETDDASPNRDPNSLESENSPLSFNKIDLASRKVM